MGKRFFGLVWEIEQKRLRDEAMEPTFSNYSLVIFKVKSWSVILLPIKMAEDDRGFGRWCLWSLREEELVNFMNRKEYFIKLFSYLKL